MIGIWYKCKFKKKPLEKVCIKFKRTDRKIKSGQVVRLRILKCPQITELFREKVNYNITPEGAGRIILSLPVITNGAGGMLSIRHRFKLFGQPSRIFTKGGS